MYGEHEERIRARAYALWEASGREHGHDREHWDQAEREHGAADADGNGRAEAMPSAGHGLSTGLQPGGTTPGSSPASGMGAIGTGGGSAGRSTGSTKRASG